MLEGGLETDPEKADGVAPASASSVQVVPRRSFQSISDAWEKSQAFARLAPRTKLDYFAAKDKIDAKWGAYPLDVIEDPKIRPRFLDWRDQMGERSPRQADAVFGVLRIILEWARDRGLIGLNHATRPKKLYRSDRSDKLWLPEHLAAFRQPSTRCSTPTSR